MPTVVQPATHCSAAVIYGLGTGRGLDDAELGFCKHLCGRFHGKDGGKYASTFCPNGTTDHTKPPRDVLGLFNPHSFSLVKVGPRHPLIRMRPMVKQWSNNTPADKHFYMVPTEQALSASWMLHPKAPRLLVSLLVSARTKELRLQAHAAFSGLQRLCGNATVMCVAFPDGRMDPPPRPWRLEILKVDRPHESQANCCRQNSFFCKEHRAQTYHAQHRFLPIIRASLRPATSKLPAPCIALKAKVGAGREGGRGASCAPCFASVS